MLEVDKIMEENSVIPFFALAVFWGSTLKLRAGGKLGWGVACGFRKELLPEKIPGFFFNTSRMFKPFCCPKYWCLFDYFSLNQLCWTYLNAFTNPNLFLLIVHYLCCDSAELLPREMSFLKKTRAAEKPHVHRSFILDLIKTNWHVA